MSGQIRECLWKSITITISLPEVTMLALEEMSKKKNIRVDGLIRKAVFEFLVFRPRWRW